MIKPNSPVTTDGTMARYLVFNRISLVRCGGLVYSHQVDSGPTPTEIQVQHRQPLIQDIGQEKHQQPSTPRMISAVGVGVNSNNGLGTWNTLPFNTTTIIISPCN